MVPVFIVTVGGQTPVSSHLSPIYTSKGTYENHSYKRPAPVTDTFLRSVRLQSEIFDWI